MTKPNENDPKDQGDTGPDLDLSEDEAQELLDADDSDDSGKDEPNPLQAEVDKWKALSRKNEKAFRDASTKLKSFEDEGKSDKQRLEESAAEHRTRAEKAEATAKALQIAIERAPEHASLAQVRAVAKRVRGDDDDAMESDADELFELLAPEPPAGARTPGRPKERLKGGNSEPDEEPDETDPKKLAAMLPRRR